MTMPPIEMQCEFEQDALMQMFRTIGWSFFRTWVAEECQSAARGLLTSDPRDAAGIAALQGRVKALQIVMEFEARTRAEAKEGTGS